MPILKLDVNYKIASLLTLMMSLHLNKADPTITDDIALFPFVCFWNCFPGVVGCLTILPAS